MISIHGTGKRNKKEELFLSLSRFFFRIFSSPFIPVPGMKLWRSDSSGNNRSSTLHSLPLSPSVSPCE